MWLNTVLDLVSMFRIVAEMFCFVDGTMASVTYDDFFRNNSRYMTDTICSYVQSKVMDTQRHVVDLLYECVFIRDGLALLPRWFLKSNLQTIVNCLSLIHI